MKMHIRSPALVFEEKSGEKKGSYYASKCGKLSRNVCNLIHSEDQLQRITLLESQMHIPYHAETSVFSPMKWLNNFNSLSLKLWESAWIDVRKYRALLRETETCCKVSMSRAWHHPDQSWAKKARHLDRTSGWLEELYVPIRAMGYYYSEGCSNRKTTPVHPGWEA